MKKTLSYLVMVVVVLMVTSISFAEDIENPLAGCGIKADGTPIKIAWVTAQLFNEAAATMDGIIHSWVKRAGGEVTTYDAQGNVEQQIAQMETIIQQKPDAILIFPVDGNALVPVCEKAVEAGIPVFNIDAPVNSEVITCYVTYNDWNIGKACADWLINNTGDEKINVYVLWGAFSMDIAHWRHDGFVDELKKYPEKVTIMEGPDCGWQSEKAMDAIMSAWPSHPELNAIYQPGGMTEGVVEAFRSLDRLYPAGDPKHVYFCTSDEDPSNMKGLREGYIDIIATHSHWVMMDIAVKAILNKVILGREVPKIIRIPSVGVTLDNVDDPGPEWGQDLFWGEKDRSNFDSWQILDTSAVIEQPWQK